MEIKSKGAFERRYSLGTYLVSITEITAMNSEYLKN